MQKEIKPENEIKPSNNELLEFLSNVPAVSQDKSIKSSSVSQKDNHIESTLTAKKESKIASIHTAKDNANNLLLLQKRKLTLPTFQKNFKYSNDGVLANHFRWMNLMSNNQPTPNDSPKAKKKSIYVFTAMVITLVLLFAIIWLSTQNWSIFSLDKKGYSAANSKANSSDIKSEYSQQAVKYYHEANAKLANHNPQAAIIALKRSIDIDPSYSLAYRSLGIAYMLIGEENSAINAYEKFIALAPGHRDAAKIHQLVTEYRRRTIER
ncbi:MAG: hypothetical protein JW841_04360 [Deltaproteobacteria bacterium]|nr:hypothetical protein [Deltaproteobacteria bacterium]